MKHTRLRASACLAVLLLLMPDGRVAVQRNLEPEALAVARRLSAHALDDTLPTEPLAGWMVDALGGTGAPTLEVDDCGEQSGDPRDQDRLLPICVTFLLDRGGGDEAGISVLVGTRAEGLVSPPSLHHAWIRSGQATELFDSASRLAERLDPWGRAAAAILQLAPERFTRIPPRVAGALIERGCRIPQAWGEQEPHNIVSGDLSGRGGTDWAALCSRDEVSRIVVIWDGPAACASEVEAHPDRDFLQNVGAEGIRFSRGIGVVPADRLERYWTYADSAPRPPATHDALSDAFYEKGATAYYCHEGTWLRFTTG